MPHVRWVLALFRWCRATLARGQLTCGWGLQTVHKQMLFRSEAREKFLRGTLAHADAVCVTLGPKSKSVLMQKSWGAPTVCNDGLTIAKEVVLENPQENLCAQLLRQAAEKTGASVGDGTTTSTLLAHVIFAKGTRNVMADASGIDIKRGLERGLAVSVQALKDMPTLMTTRIEEAQIATVSAHNDPAIGELIADVMEKVGDDGILTVEESRTADKAPGFGDRRKAMLEDIAVLNGAQLISEELGLKLENVGLAQLGHLARVVSDRETTTMIGGSGDKSMIDARVQQIRAEIDRATSDYDREKLQERLARLSGGVAVSLARCPLVALAAKGPGQS